jgi:hypothetical protein
MSGGDITLTIQDGGANTAINVPSSNVRVKIGCLLTNTAAWSASGANPTAVVNQIVSATQAVTLAPYFVGGKLLESAGLDCAGGATVLCIGVPVVTPGTATAVTATRAAGTPSTSVLSVTLDSTNGAWDRNFIQVNVTAAGTIGTAGIFFQVSLDAGRNFGPPIALGTATTYKIRNTGVQLNFAAGTLNVGDVFRFSTVPPAGNTAGWQAALTALQTSQYALTGWGAIHLVDGVSGANATTLQGYLGGSPDGTGGLAAGYVYTHMIVDVADSNTPTAWGGSGDTEAAWMSRIEADYAATSAMRVCAPAGHYNMPSAFAQPDAGTPAYRRNLSWALDVRESAIPPQRHAGRVSDGALGNIVVNPTSDPTDGFIYHDERLSPGLTAARFCAAKTRIGKQGYFIEQPNMMAPSGSVFTAIYLRAVMDIGCFITFQAAEEEIDEDVRLNANGTLYANDRLSAQGEILNAINANMTSVNMLSPGSTVVIDPNANVQATNNVPVTVSLQRRGYVLSMTINIGYAAPTAA